MTDPDLPRCSAADDLNHAREVTEPLLRATIGRLPGFLRRVAEHHLGWSSSRSVGKYLRPALVLLSCAAAGGATHQAASAAAAVELVHNYTLVHDDIVDQGTVRRHRPAAWKAFGVGPAVVGGDAFLCLAVQVVAESCPPQAIGVLAHTLELLIEGETRDLDPDASVDDITVDDVEDIAGRKTGSLMGTACELGAIHGKANVAQRDRLQRFGWHLGIAFQIRDDLRDLYADPAVLGKPRFGDLREFTASFPVIAAITSGHPAGDKLGEIYRAGRPWSESALHEAAELVEQAEGRELAEAETRRHLQISLEHLQAAQCQPEATDRLSRLATWLTTEDS